MLINVTLIKKYVVCLVKLTRSLQLHFFSVANNKTVFNAHCTNLWASDTWLL